MTSPSMGRKTGESKLQEGVLLMIEAVGFVLLLLENLIKAGAKEALLSMVAVISLVLD
jgi:Na+-transporting methylmalonyl-CoA/oxaloacetate decarboxylase gamma subunit